MENKEQIQYYHDFKNGRTFALDVNFNKQDLLESLSQPFAPARFYLGVSHLHPEDRYNKKTGREVSSKNIKPVKFILLSFERLYDIVYIVYYSEEDNLFIKFRVLEYSDKPHFLQAE